MIDFVEIQNFKSFKHWDKLHFAELDPGLYFVTGENLVEPEMGANGAGKSALFEAICWCLYGKTSTNLRAGNIVSWGEKYCSVMVGFDSFGVTRGQNPNYLKIDGDPVTQDFLEAKLGYLGFESFLYSTFISQFSSKFFDLSPAEKMGVFSDVMAESLYPWANRSDRAKEQATALFEQITNEEKVINRLKGKREAHVASDYKEQIEKFEDMRKIDLELAKTDLEIALDNYKSTKESLKETKKELEKLNLQLAKVVHIDFAEENKFITDTYGALTAETKKNIDETRLMYDRDSRGMFSTEATIKQFGDYLVKINGISQEPICPTCLQKVNPAILDKEKSDVHKKLVSLETELMEMKRSVIIHKEMLQTLNDKQNTLVKEKEEKLAELNVRAKNEQKVVGEITVKLRVMETTKKETEKRIQDWTDKIKSVTNEIEEIKSRKNHYLELEKQRLDSIAEIDTEMSNRQSVVDMYRREHDACTYWVKGFKDIRLLVMYDALKEFEVSINNNLSKFGMADWNVKLDIDKENKSGTFTKGFSVLVESPDHTGHVPFEVWSGGEGQRIRLAGTLGLMDLIQSKRQVDFGVEIFDEPTAWLSEKGIEDLLEILYYRAKENQSRIFVIDHKNLGNFGGFHNTLKVTKDKKGSRVDIFA
jgi:DNA repair exonuclease SbcCD ATPase subunit